MHAVISGSKGLRMTYDQIGHDIYHDSVCRCGHVKGLHAGAEADGRCVLRRCGCGKFEERT